MAVFKASTVFRLMLLELNLYHAVPTVNHEKDEQTRQTSKRLTAIGKHRDRCSIIQFQIGDGRWDVGHLILWVDGSQSS